MAIRFLETVVQNPIILFWKEGKEMKKKLLRIILSLAVALTMIPMMSVTTFAETANKQPAKVQVELMTAEANGSAVKLSWTKADKATMYAVYGQKWGEPFEVLKKTSKTSFTVEKINGKKLESHELYKFHVIAYEKEKKFLKSKDICFITSNTMGKYANVKSISANTENISLKPGENAEIKATTKIYKSMKHISGSYGDATRYISDCPDVATVSSKGSVTAKTSGKAVIYVQDIGGLYCKVTVNVTDNVIEEKSNKLKVKDSASGEEIFESIVNMGEPAGYNPDQPKNPYAYKDYKTVLMRNSGLMFGGSGYGKTSNSREVVIGKGYLKNEEPIEKGYLREEAWDKYHGYHDSDVVRDYSNMRTVSLDPDGDGLRDIIACVGANLYYKDKDNPDIRLWTMNTNDGHTDKATEDNEVSLGKATWMKDNSYYYGNSFLSITSGDYDADGKDTIVVYAAYDDGYGLYEFSYNEEDHSLQKIDESKILLNPAYNDEQPECHDSTSYMNKLKAGITSGDINNDGIDDLVVTSETSANNNKDSEVKAANIDTRKAYVGVSFGEEGMTTSPVSKSDTSTYVESDDGEMSLTATTADIGRIGIDENNKLTVCGYRVVKNYNADGTVRNYYQFLDPTSPQKAQLKVQENGYTTGRTYTEAYFYEINNKGELVKYRADSYGFWTDEALYTCWDNFGNDITLAPVASAYVDGYNKQEHLFINGRIFKINGNGQLDQLSGFFNEQVNYFTDAVSASLTANTQGVEQFVVAYEGANPHTDWNDSCPSCSIISGNAVFNEDGFITKPCSGYTSGNGYYYTDGSGASNAVVAPFENENTDIMLVRLNKDHGTGYYYSNPEPRAVLQAAPYFEELNTSGSTTYGVTSTYSESETTTQNSSVALSYGADVSFGLFKQTFSKTYTEAISSGFGSGKSESFTTSFTANSKDTVVLEMTPVIYYSYDVYDDSKDTWNENALGLTFAKEPVYMQITVDQYNDFAEYYNEYIKDHPTHYEYEGEDKVVEVQNLKTIDKTAYYLGKEGKPEGYVDDWNRLPDGLRVSKATMSLGYHGGSSTCNYGQETSQSEVYSKTNTISYNFGVSVGGVGSFLGGWVTGSLNKSEGTTYSTQTTNGEGYSISGTVNDPDVDEYTKSGEFSEDPVKAYNFQWTFGMSTFTTHDKEEMPEGESADIPVVGYSVNKVTKGIKPPKLDKLTETGDLKIHMSWDEPQLREGETITGYNVYVADIDGDYEKVTDSPLSKDIREYEYEPLEVNTEYSVVVTAVGKTNEKQTKEIESIPSNERSIIITPKEKETITVGVKDKTLTYGDELALTEDDLIFSQGADKSKIKMDNLGWTASYREGCNAGVYTMKAKGLESEEYRFEYEEGFLKVNEKILTDKDLTASASDKVYDGSTEATGTVTVSSGLCGDDIVKVTYESAAFDNPEPGTDKLVTFEGLEISGARAFNYILNVEDKVTAKASISKHPVKVWASDGKVQKYTAEPKEISVGSNPELDTAVAYYRLSEDGVVGDKADAPEAIGRYMFVITLTEENKDRYEIPDALSENEEDFKGKEYENLKAGNIGIMEIVYEDKKPFEFEDSMVEKTYGDDSFIKTPTNVPDDATSIRYKVTDGEDVLSVKPETGEVKILKPGTSMIEATAYRKDYPIASAEYFVSVSKKQITINMSDDVELVYNGQNQDMPYTISGDLEGNRIERDDIVFAFTGIDDVREHNPRNAGEYKVNAKIPADNEYYFTDGQSTGVMSIIKKTLEIKPNSGQSKKYGKDDPKFTYQAVGLVEGDILRGSLGREEGNKAGQYAYTLGTLTGENYNLFMSKNASKFIITPAPVYCVPNAEASIKDGKVTIKWGKVKNADSYDVYVAYGNNKFSKPAKTVSADKSSVTIKKINGKKISKKKIIKCRVDANRPVNGENNVYAESLTLYLSPEKGSKYTDAKAIKIESKSVVELPIGKKALIRAKTTKKRANRKLLGKKYAEQYRYMTTADYIATVDENGVITPIGAGTCYIEVYAQNGKSAKVKVIVKWPHPVLKN